MPTKSERKALVFLGAVACLGGGVRVMRAHLPQPPVAARRALDAHISQIAGRVPVAIGSGVAQRDTNPPVGRRRKPAPSTRRPPATAAVTASVAAPPPPGPFNRVDVDRASAADLQALPGIGPALAGRIVANRDSVGPFRGLQQLGRVKGIGPATLKRLDSLVTFSGIRPP